jgi:hypothetical protein
MPRPRHSWYGRARSRARVPAISSPWAERPSSSRETSLTFSRISQFQGSIKRAGSPVGNLTGCSVTYSNNLEKIETIRDDGLIEGADPTIAALTGGSTCALPTRR